VNRLTGLKSISNISVDAGHLLGDNGKQPTKERNMVKKVFTTEQAKEVAKKLGVDFKKWNVEQFRMGMDVELEHGKVDPRTNVTNDDPVMTGKIAWAHLNEIPDYYTRLYEREKEAEDKT
jgi:hypothetical protein